MYVKYSTTPTPYCFRSIGLSANGFEMALCCGFCSCACSSAMSKSGGTYAPSSYSSS